ncbi:M16 family metallopeptidase [Janibacter sp. GXQ6167]|uniref:M16 family metallopeptidase n=1 Tax=Janibacter sp. GXQ6167 TaxID=3240791 RepID=UPI00352567B5
MSAVLPRPSVQPAGTWTFPTPREIELANGLTVLVYDVPGQYVISVRLSVPAPLRAEPREREGVAAIMARLLDEGTATHSQLELAELLERHGIAMGAGVSEQALGVDLEVSRRHLETGLELLTECLTEPVFAAEEVTRMVRTRLAEIAQERASAGRRAHAELVAAYYDPSARASRPGAGSPESVAAITRDDVVAFHAEHVHPDHASLVLAGDVGGLDVEALLAATIGTWPRSVHPRPEPTREPAARAADRQRIVLVDRPGSVQSEIAMATPGPDRRGEWAPFPVLGWILGGAPNARIDAILREEKGYTYGVRALFRPRQVGGMLIISGSVRADATAESVSLLTEIVAGMEGGVTEAEARAGIDFATLTAPGRYETADAIADEAIALAADGLPLTFTSDNVAAMRALTVADLDEAWRREVTEGWTVVVVGDAASVADGLRELGEVTIIS